MFFAGNINYKGHWKGWALKIKTFMGPEMATSEASPFWAQNITVRSATRLKMKDLEI